MRFQAIDLYTGPMRRVASASNEREPVNVQVAQPAHSQAATEAP